jgi:hypothetical protein
MPMRGVPTALSTLAIHLAIVGGLNNAALAQSGVREGKNAFGGWQTDKPGTVRLIKPQDLPGPGATEAVGRRAAGSQGVQGRTVRGWIERATHHSRRTEW